MSQEIVSYNPGEINLQFQSKPSVRNNCVRPTHQPAQDYQSLYIMQSAYVVNKLIQVADRRAEI